MSPCIVYLSYLLKFFLLFSGVTIICVKPLYTISFFTIFFIEYFYFIYYLILIYSYFDNSYHRISINLKDVSSMSSPAIWFNISQLHAFKRVYILLLRKKFNLKNIVLVLLILILGIPYKFCKLMYILIISKHCFRDWLEIKYINTYDSIRNSKIEILNNKIYIECPL